MDIFWNCTINNNDNNSVDQVSVEMLMECRLSIKQESIESTNQHTTEDTCSTHDPYGVRLQNQAYHGVIQCKGFSVPVAQLHPKIYRVPPSEHRQTLIHYLSVEAQVTYRSRTIIKDSLRTWISVH